MSFWEPIPVLVAGPCTLEDNELNLAIARRVSDLAKELGIFAVFKGSFDKANRSSHRSPRGPGIELGLDLLSAVKSEAQIPVLTDVHEVWQVESVSAVVDAIQIPAFLCRQTDLLEAAGGSGLPVNIKKGQWMSAEAMEGAVLKVRNAGCNEVSVTERGSFFGYGDLVVDMRNVRRMPQATGAHVLFDATHSVQKPGQGPNGSTGGSREYISDLINAAAAVRVDGFYLETHPSPHEAPSDAASMLPLGDLDKVVERAVAVWNAAGEGENQ